MLCVCGAKNIWKDVLGDTLGEYVSAISVQRDVELFSADAGLFALGRSGDYISLWTRQAGELRDSDA